MIRKIIHINEENCSGCGACAAACHEGAIQMVDGKARLIRDDYCDGLGDCLPACPANAISFEEREAPAYDAEAVKAHLKKQQNSPAENRQENKAESPTENRQESQLLQWPVQIRLAPAKAPYFDDADLLIAADCTAYAYADFHNRFIKNHITLIGCPKLDAVDYSEKLSQILSSNRIRSITLVRMEVPCCGGLQYAAAEAIKKSGKNIPINIITVSLKGKLIQCTD